MDMDRIHRLMRDLRLANECEAAASMDVEDAKANVEFYKRKLEITEARHQEAANEAKKVGDRLFGMVAMETMAPLVLMIEHEG